MPGDTSMDPSPVMGEDNHLPLAPQPSGTLLGPEPSLDWGAQERLMQEASLESLDSAGQLYVSGLTEARLALFNSSNTHHPSALHVPEETAGRGEEPASPRPAGEGSGSARKLEILEVGQEAEPEQEEAEVSAGIAPALEPPLKPKLEKTPSQKSTGSDTKYKYMNELDLERPKTLAEIALEVRLREEVVEEELTKYQVIAIKICKSSYFENGIVLLILANCVSLAMFKPLEGDEPGSWNWTLGWIENVFNFCFTGEIVLRMVAINNVVKHFQSAWNIFDFFIVLVGYSSFVQLGAGGAESLRALRALRALRPLRTVSQVKSLRNIANSFVEAMPMLLSVVGVLFFYLVVCAICGLSLFMEGIHHRCGTKETHEPLEPEAFGCNGGGGRTCPPELPVCLWAVSETNQVGRFAPDEMNPNVTVPYRLRPETWPGYDNFFQSFITVFISTTLEGWQDIMYRSVDGTGAMSVIFFVLMVLTGPFFIVNLFLAVLKIKFADIGKSDAEKERLFAEKAAKKKAQRKGRSSMLNMATAKGLVPKRMTEGKAGPVTEALAPVPEENSFRQASGSQMGGTPSGSVESLNHSFRGDNDDNDNANDSMREKSGKKDWQALLEEEYPSRPWIMRKVYDVVNAERFNTFFLVCIGVNTVCLSMDHHNMSKSLKEFLLQANLVLTIMFTGELLLKMAGLRLKYYFRDSFNCFDFVIVLISLIEIMPFMNGVGISLTALRSFRVLRVFKLFKHMPALAKIVGVLLSSAASFFSIGILLFLFLTVFSIIGLHVYGEIGPLEGVRGSFKDIYHSYIILFQVLTLEDWNTVMMAVARQSNYYSAIFFIAWVVFGNYILLTLFLAVVMEAFEAKYDMDAKVEEKKKRTLKDIAMSLRVGAWRQVVRMGNQEKRVDEETAEQEKQKMLADNGNARQWHQDSEQAAVGVLADTSTSSKAAIRKLSLNEQSQQQESEGSSFHSTGPLLTQPPLPSAKGGGGAGLIEFEDEDIDEDEDIKVIDMEQRQPTPPAGPVCESRAHWMEEVLAPPAPNTLPSARPPTLVQVFRERTLHSRQRSSMDGPVSEAFGDARNGAVDVLEFADEDPELGAHALPQPPTRLSSGEFVPRPPAQPRSMEVPFVRRDFTISHLSTPTVVNRTANRNLDHSDSFGSVHTRQHKADIQAEYLENDQDLETVELGEEKLAAGDGGGAYGGAQKFLEEKLISELDAAVSAINARAATTPPPQRKPAHVHTGIGRSPLGAGAVPGRGVAAQEGSPGTLADGSRSSRLLKMGDKLRRQSRELTRGPSIMARNLWAKALEKHVEKLNEDPTESEWLKLAKLQLKGKSFGLLSVEHPLRLACHSLLSYRHYELMMTWCIVISCLQMAIEVQEIERGSDMGQILMWTEYVTTSLFTIEAVMKIIELGFVHGESTYLRSLWNQLDFFIVLTSLISFLLESPLLASGDDQEGVVGAVRVLRAVRPMRIVSRSPNIQLVVQSLALSMVSMFHVVMLLLLFYLIFAILGTQMFMGLFYSCRVLPTDNLFLELDRYKFKYNREECEDPDICEGCEWTVPFLNFDNVGDSMMTLFAVSTTDQWMRVLYDALDSGIKVDEHPRKYSNSGAFLYFVFFICIMGFALMNLFSGVVFFQFTRIKMRRQTNDAVLTEKQKHWNLIVFSVANTKFPLRVDPPEGDGRWIAVRKWVFGVVMHTVFDSFIMVCIILVTFSMMMPHYNQSEEWTNVLNQLNLAFSAVFVVECVMKIIALTWTEYWRSGWNRFDLVLVVSSIMDVGLEFMSASFLRVLRFGRITRITRISRITRLTRLARVAKSLKGVQSLVQCIALSLASFWTVGTLLVLAFFIYSYIGVVLFRRVAHGEWINEHANFETFGTASLTLLRVATMEAWVGLMEECSVTNCNPSKEGGGGCGGPWATPFFCSFLVVVSTILLQLFTAVIIQNFEELESRELWGVPEQNIKKYLECWTSVSKDARVHINEFELILRKLPMPLGVTVDDGRSLDGTCHNARVIRRLRNVDIMIQPSTMHVFFYSTLYAMACQVCHTDMPPGSLKERAQNMAEQVFLNDFKVHDNLNKRAKDKEKARRYSRIRKARGGPLSRLLVLLGLREKPVLEAADQRYLDRRKRFGKQADDMDDEELYPSVRGSADESIKRGSADGSYKDMSNSGLTPDRSGKGLATSLRAFGGMKSVTEQAVLYDANGRKLGPQEVKKVQAFRSTSPTLQMNMHSSLKREGADPDSLGYKLGKDARGTPVDYDELVPISHVFAVRAIERGWLMRHERQEQVKVRLRNTENRARKLAELRAQGLIDADGNPIEAPEQKTESRLSRRMSGMSSSLGGFITRRSSIDMESRRNSQHSQDGVAATVTSWFASSPGRRPRSRTSSQGSNQGQEVFTLPAQQLAFGVGRPHPKDASRSRDRRGSNQSTASSISAASSFVARVAQSLGYTLEATDPCDDLPVRYTPSPVPCSAVDSHDDRTRMGSRGSNHRAASVTPTIPEAGEEDEWEGIGPPLPSDRKDDGK